MIPLKHIRLVVFILRLCIFLFFLTSLTPSAKTDPFPITEPSSKIKFFRTPDFFPKFLIPSFWRRLCMLRYSFQRSWWPKNPAVWLGKTHNWPHLNKISSFKMLSFFDNYLHAKNQRYLLIHSSHIVNQRVLQCDWKRSTPAHIQS